MIAVLKKLVLFGAALQIAICSAADFPDRLIEVRLTGSDHQTYKRLPFDVPSDVGRITIETEYTGQSERTVVDFGLIDQADKLVGWSGGNKKTFTLSEFDATPSYSPRGISPGIWHLLIGVPNIRPDSTSLLKAKIYFSKSADPIDEPGVLRTVINSRNQWYRGDLHAHSGHSDGTCASAHHKLMVPCPTYKVIEKARERKLDFLALTEHNTGSQANSLRELQPFFDDILLLSGRELTSFYGHANAIGLVQNIDFQAKSAQDGWNSQLISVSNSVFVSVNHPVRPGGEFCMGCAWLGGFPNPAVQGIEIANGDDMGTRYSGLDFWEKLLELGHKLTAVAGSDNHNPDKDWYDWSTLGRPSNWVLAEDLSQSAIIKSLRQGHVVLDFSKDESRIHQPPIEMIAKVGDQVAQIGDSRLVPLGQTIDLEITTSDNYPRRLFLHSNAAMNIQYPNGQGLSPGEKIIIKIKMPNESSWIWAEIRDEKKNVLALTNPIYFTLK